MSMQAYQFDRKGPIGDVLGFKTVPKPGPAPGQSLVKIIASAVNPADCKNVEGQFPATQPPRIPGRDFAGKVEGGEHDGLEVWGTGGGYGFAVDGTHAEYLVVPNNALAPKPLNLSFSQAAASGLSFLTASAMVSRAGVKKGEYVLILGSSGAVGSAATQLVRNLGATPLETSRTDKSGYVTTESDDLVPQTQTLSNGAGVDVVLDAVSDAALFQKALNTLNYQGRYVIITAPRSADRKLSFDALSLYREERSVSGVNTLKVSFEESISHLKQMQAGFENGHLAPPSRIREVAFHKAEDVIQAYVDVLKGSKEKVVLTSKV
ncbi:MAG: hypothetical protein M1833_000314 [Piccolia ochrophora]|nr:MAG: hypothetical protein M1833_000314 [Piccolia ochrophora]